MADTTNSNQKPTLCRYVGDKYRGIAEERPADGAVYCDAEAEIIVRIAHSMPAKKTPVCREHAQFLRSDECEINWEWCGNVRDLDTGSDPP